MCQYLLERNSANGELLEFFVTTVFILLAPTVILFSTYHSTVLYPVGPPFYHGQYTVTIHCLWDDTLTLIDNCPERQLSWTLLATTERVTTHVNKVKEIAL